MPPTIPTLGSGGQSLSQACSGQTMGYVIAPTPVTIRYSGFRVQSNSTWNSIGQGFVNQGNEWKSIESVYVVNNGEWKQSAATLQEGADKVRIKLTMCGGFEVCGDVGGNSPMVYTTPNQLYIPTGWLFRTVRWSARYDDTCDGVFLAQSPQLASSLGQTKRRALILCRRSNPVYTSLSSANAACSNVPYGGRNASEFLWTTPSWAYLNLPNGQSGNMRGLRLYSRNTTTNANMCGGAGGPTTEVQLVHDNYALPFPIDQIISMRSQSNCGKYKCNHYLCDNSSYLEFDEPPPTVPPEV
jgi:hypothetical protein